MNALQIQFLLPRPPLGPIRNIKRGALLQDNKDLVRLVTDTVLAFVPADQHEDWMERFFPGEKVPAEENYE